MFENSDIVKLEFVLLMIQDIELILERHNGIEN